jgi:uncharacterized membrane protein YwzB
MKIPHILTVLGINAVPALGWLLGDWNSGTTLAVYWCETVLGSLFIAARAVLHRRVVRVRGHFRYEPPKDARQNGAGIPFLRHFLPVTLMFSAVHAVFLGALIFLMTHNGRGAQVRLNLQDLAVGVGLILAFQVVDFLIDLVQIKTRPFRWIEVMAERNVARVLIIHLTIIVGMAVGGWMDSARGFFLVFVVLKTMNDLNSLVPQYDPEEAPRWLSRLMNMVPNATGKKQTFEEFWKEGKVGERARVAKNEQPYNG